MNYLRQSLKRELRFEQDGHCYSPEVISNLARLTMGRRQYTESEISGAPKPQKLHGRYDVFSQEANFRRSRYCRPHDRPRLYTSSLQSVDGRFNYNRDLAFDVDDAAEFNSLPYKPRSSCVWKSRAVSCALRPFQRTLYTKHTSSRLLCK